MSYIDGQVQVDRIRIDRAHNDDEYDHGQVGSREDDVQERRILDSQYEEHLNVFRFKFFNNPNRFASNRRTCDENLHPERQKVGIGRKTGHVHRHSIAERFADLKITQRIYILTQSRRARRCAYWQQYLDGLMTGGEPKTSSLTDYVLEDDVPSDEEGQELADGHIDVCIGASTARNPRTELSVA